jgi:hypothetical protein
MVFRRGGWVWAAFGFVICVLPSVVCTVLAVRLHRPDDSFGKTAAIFGLLLLWGLAGLFPIFLRLEQIIDHRLGLVVDRWWVLWLTRTKLYALQDFKLVFIQRTSAPGYDNIYRYWVCLGGSVGGKYTSVTLAEYGDRCHDQAWEKAKEVARFVGFPAVDLTNDARYEPSRALKSE